MSPATSEHRRHPATVADLISSETQPKDRGKWRELANMKLFCLWMLYVSLGVVMLGFDWSCYPQLLAMPKFGERFGHFDKATGLHIVSSYRQGVWNGASSAAQAAGGLVSGAVMDKIGRRWWLLAMSSLGILSIGVIYAAPGWELLAVGRAIQGFSVGATTTFTPLYIGESSLPELRGVFLVCFNTFIVVGQFMVTLVCRATVDLDSDSQWRIPILTMFFFPSLVLIFFPWFPESPYFLLKHKNDKEGALNALLRLYGPSNRQLAEMQITKMESALQSTEASNHSINRVNYIQLFKGKNLQRTIVAFTAPASQVLSGIIFVVGYLPYFLTLVGFDEVFNWNMYLFAISLSANLFSFWTVERVGRRKVTICGLFILMVVMFIIGGLNVQPSQSRYMATIGLIYVWAAVFQLSIGPLGYTLASEVATASLRAETQAVVTVSNALFGWTFSFSVPYMINPDAGNLGGKVGFLFGGLGFFCTLLGFFLFPETKGMTFAELDWAYLNDIKPWRFSEAIAEQRLAERAGNGLSKRASSDGAVHVEDSRKV